MSGGRAHNSQGPWASKLGGWELTFHHGWLRRLHLVTEKHLLSLEENGCLSHCCRAPSCLPSVPTGPAALTFPARTRRPELGSKSGIRGLRDKKPHWRHGQSPDPDAPCLPGAPAAPSLATPRRGACSALGMCPPSLRLTTFENSLSGHRVRLGRVLTHSLLEPLHRPAVQPPASAESLQPASPIKQVGEKIHPLPRRGGGLEEKCPFRALALAPANPAPSSGSCREPCMALSSFSLPASGSPSATGKTHTSIGPGGPASRQSSPPPASPGVGSEWGGPRERARARRPSQSLPQSRGGRERPLWGGCSHLRRGPSAPNGKPGPAPPAPQTGPAGLASRLLAWDGRISPRRLV